MAFKQVLEFAVDVVDHASSKFKQIGQSADTNLGNVTTHTKGIGGAFESAAAKSPLLTNALGKVGLSGAQAGTMISSALPGAMLVAGGAVAAFGVHAFSTFQDLAGSVLDFQRIVGGTAEASSAFVAVLDDYEISAEAGAAAISKMARAAETSPEKFAKYGVEIAKNADGTTNLQETLLNAAEAYANTGDDATKAALGAALFGKGYATLIPILEKGKDGADGLAAAFANVDGQQILSQDKLTQAEDARLALDNLMDTVNELALSVGSSLAPAVEVIADLLAGLSDLAINVEKHTGDLNEGLLGTGAGVVEVSNAMGEWQALGGGDFIAGMGDAAMATDAAALALSMGLTPAHVINAVAVENDATATKNKAAADAEAKTKADEFTAALDAQRAAADLLYASTNALIDSDLAYRDSVDQTEDAVNTYWAALGTASAAGFTNVEANEAMEDAGRRAERAIIDEAAAAVDAAVDQATLAGETLTAAEKANIQKDALEKLKIKFPELLAPIQAMIDKLNAIPRAVHTNFTSTIHAPGGGQATGGTFEDGEVRHAATGVTFLHVGEQGPEDVALFGNGRVLNRADTMAAAANGQGRSAGSVVIQNANFYDAVDVDLFARRVTFAMAIV